MTKSNKIKSLKADGNHKKKSAFFIKRWWDNYLARLNKITKGKPQCCE